jgi:hypothetical protein
MFWTVGVAFLTYSGSSGGAGKLEEVTKPTLLETSYQQPHLKLVDLVEILGNTGWLKVLRLDDYAARKPRRLQALQQALFPYHEAWG